MIDAENILKRFEALEAERGEWEGVWQQCADYVLPRLGRHHRRADQIFDSTAPLALGRFAAAMESFLTPRTHKWHSLAAGRTELNHDPDVGRWLEALRDLLFSRRYAAESNFANQILEAYLSLGVHGTAVMFVDDEPGLGLRYQCVPLHEAYLAVDGVGRVDTVFRWYRLTARQALAAFGDELPEDIRRDAEDPRAMDREHEFIHGVFPRRDLDPNRRGPRHLPIASVHLARAARRVVRESGYRTMPYAVSRFTVTSGEVYGRSPAMEVMADIVQVNAMKKTILRAAEKMVNPPLLTPEDDILTAFSLKTGSINYGGLDDQGRQRVVPLQLGGNLPVGRELVQESQKVINEAFYGNLFQILVESPQKTATEVMELALEKAQLLAPAVGRQQSELLRPIIERELDILIQGGALDALPPLPPALAAGARGLEPKYETDLAQAVSARDGQAILKALAALGALAQFDPEVMNLIDAQAAGRAIWRSFGAPAAVTRSAKEMKKLQAEQSQAKEARALLEGLNQAGQTLGRMAPGTLKALPELLEKGAEALNPGAGPSDGAPAPTEAEA